MIDIEPARTFPIDETHSDIVKFGPSSIHIDTVLDKLIQLHNYSLQSPRHTSKVAVGSDIFKETTDNRSSGPIQGSEHFHDYIAPKCTSLESRVEALRDAMQIELGIRSLENSVVMEYE